MRGRNKTLNGIRQHPSSDLATLGHLLPQGEKVYRALFCERPA